MSEPDRPDLNKRGRASAIEAGGAPPPHLGYRRISEFAAYFALAVVFVGGAGGSSFIDPDAWHQMALIREALSLGRIPTLDPFSYTSTVDPMVHHEWGMGVVLYVLGTALGGFGLALLRFALGVGIGVACVWCARRRGASSPVLWAVLPVAVFLGWVGVTTVRAQMFTLLFVALLLCCLELDRSGRRWWIAPWLVAYVLWVNLHAGFIVGVIVYALYATEDLVRGRPAWRHAGILLAMAALVGVNPYGLDYFPYLWHGIALERPTISEWRSIGQAWAPIVAVYAVSLILGGYAVARLGVRKVTGLLFLLAAAYAAARHQRHLSIYAVAWACTVPGWLQATPLGALITRLLAPTKRSVAVGTVLVATLAVGFFASHRPWDPAVPSNTGEHRLLLYPTGAVEYLEANAFHGNLLTPFNVGAFVLWKLHPAVLVSIDSRYEVAYAPELLERHRVFFAAEPGWDQLLMDFPTDAVLTPGSAPIAGELARIEEWDLVYRDDVYELFTRPSADLPFVDRRGQRLVGQFP